MRGSWGEAEIGWARARRLAAIRARYVSASRPGQRASAGTFQGGGRPLHGMEGTPWRVGLPCPPLAGQGEARAVYVSRASRGQIARTPPSRQRPTTPRVRPESPPRTVEAEVPRLEFRRVERWRLGLGVGTSVAPPFGSWSATARSPCLVSTAPPKIRVFGPTSGTRHGRIPWAARAGELRGRMPVPGRGRMIGPFRQSEAHRHRRD